jgi:uncharacterized membrane protein YfcA
MKVLFAAICLFVAVIVGGWRSYCIFWEMNLRTNCPLGWHRDWVRFGTMLIFFLTSLLASFVGAGLVISEQYELNWWISFTLLFASLWLISKALGRHKAKKEFDEFLRRVEAEGGKYRF